MAAERGAFLHRALAFLPEQKGRKNQTKIIFMLLRIMLIMSFELFEHIIYIYEYFPDMWTTHQMFVLWSSFHESRIGYSLLSFHCSSSRFVNSLHRILHIIMSTIRVLMYDRLNIFHMRRILFCATFRNGISRQGRRIRSEAWRRRWIRRRCFQLIRRNIRVELRFRIDDDLRNRLWRRMVIAWRWTRLSSWIR